MNIALIAINHNLNFETRYLKVVETAFIIPILFNKLKRNFENMYVYIYIYIYSFELINVYQSVLGVDWTELGPGDTACIILG